MYISSGSAHELEYLIIVSTQLNFIDTSESKNLLEEINEIKKMLFALINTKKNH